MDKDCIFCRIIRGEIPAKKAYEDEDCLIFHDIDPKARLHYLLIPKTHYPALSGLDESRGAALSRCLKKLADLAPELGLSDGYRVVINQGAHGGQTVFHLHLHILGGEKLGWNPG